MRAHTLLARVTISMEVTCHKLGRSYGTLNGSVFGIRDLVYAAR